LHELDRVGFSNVKNGPTPAEAMGLCDIWQGDRRSDCSNEITAQISGICCQTEACRRWPHKKTATSKKPGAAALCLAFRPSSLAACANPLTADSSRPALVAQPKHRRVLPENKLAFGIAAFFIKMHSLLFVFLQA
jgi:hypothetical protein